MENAAGRFKALEPSPTLHIWLLGEFRVELNGRRVPDAAWRRNRARALIKMLALARHHRLHREQLMDALWPDLGPTAAAGNLRRAVHFARRALVGEVVAVPGDLVSLEAAELWIDVEAFEVAAEAGRLSEALELYRGDLLPEDRFEPWAEDARERLRARFHRALLELAIQRETDGQLSDAIALLERLVASDPLNEDAQLRLMRAYVHAGARHLALRQFRELERTLRSELQVEPGDEVRQLFEDVVSGRFRAADGRISTAAAATPAPGTPAAAAAGTPAPDARAAALAERATGRLEVLPEERKLVTVLSTDSQGATADPELAGRRLDSWATFAVRVLEGWGARGDRQADGTVLAIFGVPSVREDDAARALRAALEVTNGSELPARVGVATGEVVVAAGWGRQAAVAGDVVAAAGELRAHAPPGGVLVSDRTARLAGGFEVAAAVSLSVAGRTFIAHPLLVQLPPNREPALALEAPLMGREVELATVLGAWQDVVAARRPRLVLVSGAAGVGKSRLVRELVAAIEQSSPATRVLRGRSLSGGGGSTYCALGEVFRQAAGVSLGERRAVVERRIEDRLGEVLADLSAGDRDSTVFALATSAGVLLPGNPLDDMPPEEVSRNLEVAWTRFATALAATSPTLIVLEDLHWASPELLEMIDLVAARSSGPLMVVGTARPELRETAPAFGSSSEAATLVLGPLSGRRSEDLLRFLLGEQRLEPGLEARLLGRAEGNPFYLEQLTMHLREAATETLPDTLQGLLAARLDGLSAPERRLLQEASVAGRFFWEEPLSEAFPGERVSARLAVLERKGFVVRRPTSSLPGQEEFMFRHALLHDVAYGSLTRARRTRAHAAVGAWLEARAAGRTDELIDLLAHHFWSALDSLGAGLDSLGAELDLDLSPAGEVRRKAISYLIRAGDAARQRFATDRAIELHQRGLRLAGDVQERLTALEALADDHESVFRGDLAAASYREALRLARADPTYAPDGIRLSRKLAWLMAWNPGAFERNPDAAEVETLVADALAAAPSDGERGWLLLVRGASARLYRGSEPYGQGTRLDPRPLAERIGDVEDAVAIGEAIGEEKLVAAGGHARGMLYGLEGRYLDMLELSRGEVAGLSPEAPPLERSDAVRKLAVQLININAEFELGLELGRESRTLVGDANPHQLMHTLWPIMTALFQLGRWDELLPFIDEDVAAFRIQPAVECQFVRDGPVIGAVTLALMGRRNEARELATLPGDPLADLESASAWQARWATVDGDPATARAIAHDKALERRTYGPQHAFALLEALASMGDWPAVRGFLPSARQAVSGNALLGPLIDRSEGQALAAAGEPERAVRKLRRAARGFGRLNARLEEARSLELLVGLASAREAARAAQAASEIFDGLGIAAEARTVNARTPN